MITSIKNLQGAKKVFGLLTKASLLILLVLTTCTCSGVRLMSGNQTFGNQIDYSTFSGKLAKPTNGLMVCAILRTVEADSRLCPQLNQLTLQQYQRIHGLEYCPNLVRMQKRCSRIKSYRFRSTTRSSSSRSKTVWTDPKPSSPIVYPPRNSPGVNLTPTKSSRKSPDLIQRSTGKTRVITPTMERN